MAKLVRGERWVEPYCQQVFLQHPLDTPRGKPRPVAVDQQRLRPTRCFPEPLQQRSPQIEIRLESRHRRTAEGGKTFFLSLATDPHHLTEQIEMFIVEIDKFVDP